MSFLESTTQSKFLVSNHVSAAFEPWSGIHSEIPRTSRPTKPHSSTSLSVLKGQNDIPRRFRSGSRRYLRWHLGSKRLRKDTARTKQVLRRGRRTCKNPKQQRR